MSSFWDHCPTLWPTAESEPARLSCKRCCCANLPLAAYTLRYALNSDYSRSGAYSGCSLEGGSLISFLRSGVRTGSAFGLSGSGMSGSSSGRTGRRGGPPGLVSLLGSCSGGVYSGGGLIVVPARRLRRQGSGSTVLLPKEAFRCLFVRDGAAHQGRWEVRTPEEGWVPRDLREVPTLEGRQA